MRIRICNEEVGTILSHFVFLILISNLLQCQLFILQHLLPPRSTWSLTSAVISTFTKNPCRKHKEEAVAGTRFGLIEKDETVTWKAKHFFKNRLLRVKDH